MKRLRLWVLASLMAVATAIPGLAVQPDEVLADPVLESRAREISEGLRCLVCQNESIDESNASLARDLRLLVRERLVAGDTNDEAVAFIVDRYGEFVLLRPTIGGWNWLLWGAGPALFLLALGMGVLYVRSRATAPAPTEAGLSETERKRLEELLKN